MRPVRPSVRFTFAAVMLTAVLAGCLGNDAASNDPEANDPAIMSPEPTEEPGR